MRVMVTEIHKLKTHVHQWRELTKLKLAGTSRPKCWDQGSLGGSQPEAFFMSVKSKIYTEHRVLRNICCSQYIVNGIHFYRCFEVSFASQDCLS